LGATLICLLTNTSSIDIDRLIDENYRFKFQHLIPQIDPRFLAWLTKMVEPNVNNRFANATVALEQLNNLSSIAIAQQPDRSALIKKLIVPILIISTILELGMIKHFLTKSNSPAPQTITSTSRVVASEEQWFNQIKPSCNAVEVATAIKSSPPPDTYQGVGYAAGCYALAGKIDKADGLIAQLPENLRPAATYIVFNIGHPVADAGDDESARPIMALVIKYSPDNYMAMYHLGISEYALKDHEHSKQHLQQFLQMYSTQDSWRQNALTVMDYIDRGIQTTPPPSNE
jgi:tetratricopeptide (TPR) repeat protein